MVIAFPEVKDDPEINWQAEAGDLYTIIATG